MGILRLILAFQRVLLGSRAALAAENLALRHQLGVLQRSVKRPRLRSPEDRLGATPAGPCRGRVHGRQVHGPPAEACRWNATRRFRGSSVRPNRARGAPRRIWAACTTATPERRNRQARIPFPFVIGGALRLPTNPAGSWSSRSPPLFWAGPRKHRQAAVPHQLPRHDQPGWTFREGQAWYSSIRRGICPSRFGCVPFPHPTLSGPGHISGDPTGTSPADPLRSWCRRSDARWSRNPSGVRRANSC